MRTNLYIAANSRVLKANEKARSKAYAVAASVRKPPIIPEITANAALIIKETE